MHYIRFSQRRSAKRQPCAEKTGSLSVENPLIMPYGIVFPAAFSKEIRMDKNEIWLQWTAELQGLAQAGLTYGKDVYDKERYERIREISAEMVSQMTVLPSNQVKDLFCNEIGYQTPKLDTRAAIFEDGKILLVKETWDCSRPYIML